MALALTAIVVIFVLVFALQDRVAEAFDCRGNVTVPYVNGTDSYSFPETGNDEPYNRDITCGWQVEIPPGYFGRITFHGDLTYFINNDYLSDIVSITSAYNTRITFTFKLDTKPDVDILPTYAFIQLKSGNDSSGTFGFTVTYMKQVPPAGSVSYTISDDGFIYTGVDELNNNYAVTFQAAEQILLTPLLTDDWVSNNILVYDGPTANSNLLGPVAGIWTDTSTKVYSTSYWITVHNPIPKATAETGGFLAVLGDRTQRYSCFFGMSYHFLYSKQFLCPGPIAIVYTVPQTSSISVAFILIPSNNFSIPAYTGVPQGEDLPLQNFRPPGLTAVYYPQQLPNGVFTMVNNNQKGGLMQIITTPDETYSLSTLQEGYIYSDNYGRSQLPQFKNVTYAIKRGLINYQSYEFHYLVKSNLTAGDEFLISSENETIIVVDDNRHGRVFGSQFTIFYNSHGAASSGMQLWYEVRPPAESTTVTPTTTSDAFRNSISAIAICIVLLSCCGK